MTKKKLRNIPSGKDGEGYIILNGEVLAAFKIAKVSGEVEVVAESRGFLGERMTQNAARRLSGKGNLTYYHTTSAFIKAMKEFKDGADYPAVTLHYHSENSEQGRCEVVLRDVILSNISFGALDDSSTDAQTFDTSFTFDNFDIVEAFT